MDADAVERILKDRGISVDKSTLIAALEDSRGGDKDTSFSEWAKSYLGHETLLTPDELDTFSSLVDSGTVDTLEASGNLESAFPRDEPELQAAIRELNRSTAAIGKQTETLKQQQEALAKFAKARINSEAARSDLDAVQLQKRAAETRNVKSSVEDLSRSLEIKIADLEQQSESGTTGLCHSVNDLLSTDDKLLTSLEKLGGELSLTGSQDDKVVDALRETCMRLIKCTVEMMRCRLDRLYLEGLSSSSPSTSPPASGRRKSPPVQELQEEVDSLYSELLPVAQMSVENQYLEPALRRLTRRNREALGRSSSAVEYVCECLEYLQARLDRLLSRVETLQSHRVAAETLAGAAQSELSVSVARPRKRDEDARSPSRRRKSSSHSSPARTRTNTLGSGIQRRRSSGTLLDEPPLEALYRSLAIAMPLDADGETVSGREQAASLSTLLADRTAKVDDVAASTQQSFESTMAIHFGDAQRAMRLLLDSVLADSPYGHVRLIDPEIEESITFLEQEIQKLGSRAEAIDPRQARGKSEKRNEILQRWGRG